MPKKPDSRKQIAALMPKRQRGKTTWRLGHSIRTALRIHHKWPLLKPVDWQPLARAEWGLNENIAAKDPRYNMIHSFCKNGRLKQERAEARAARAQASTLLVEEEPLIDTDAVMGEAVFLGIDDDAG